MADSNDQLQAHDALVRALLAEHDEAVALLRTALPASLAGRLDFSTLTRVPGTFVDEMLHQSQTDALFSVRFVAGGEALIYLLLEHQSRVDRWMCWRMLRYVVRVLEDWQRAHPKARRLPAIVPIVLYHGRRRWRRSLELADLFEVPDDLQTALGPHVPRFRFLLDDLTRQDDEALCARAATAFGRLVLLSLKHARDTDDPVGFFRRVAALLRELLRAPRGRFAAATVLHYHLLVNQRVDAQALGEVLAAELGEASREVVMTAGERLIAEGRARGLEEGLQQGLANGLQRGRREGEAHLLLKLVRLRFGPPPAAVVARVEAAPVADLERWGERLLTAATLDALFTDE